MLMRYVLAAFVALLSVTAHAAVKEYTLTIARQTVQITGEPVEKITVNGSIPGPTLHFTEGDEAVIHVKNTMDATSSIHWHGLVIPGDQDGVPGYNGFAGIAPGKTFTYRFTLKQAGTYWYHAHSGGQEQEGLYGGIVIAPKGGEAVHADKDYVLVLSDFSTEPAEEILAHLKMSSDYYQYHRRTVGDFFDEAEKDGLDKAMKNAGDWARMRMLRTDLSDVSGYHFLMSGLTPQENWTGLFAPGQKIRLRFINASAMTMYDVRIPGLKMQVVAADGQPVVPVTVDEFRIANAETYDVIVTPKQEKAYSIAAESIDREGFALGTLAPHEGMRGEAPNPRPRAQLTMADMNMAEMMKDDPEMDMAGMMDVASGWANTGAPKGAKVLAYEDLQYAGTQPDVRPPARTVDIRLGGNMDRYIWTINGRKFDPHRGFHFAYGERVRLRFINETMMAHPVHLHGMFLQLENGQKAARMPNKHTIIVPPGQTVTALFTASNEGSWPFHCHLLYHMLSGMMSSFIIDAPNGGSHAAH